MATDKHATAGVQVQKEAGPKPDVKDKPESGNVMKSSQMKKKRKSSSIERCLFCLCCCWMCDACSLCTKGIPFPFAGD
ncbi:hypothetical protein L6164_017881 [Bauhinia variegata]|uniref:Uncharacterized protein n=1 Tax=Bauhinia variegata TaxID=167791 RepID=A0ACB9NB58_BAUVA|nr:hypothetical protein L6164_017881 [Bauhinia variegata]